jgi:hypothetical protein
MATIFLIHSLSLCYIFIFPFIDLLFLFYFYFFPGGGGGALTPFLGEKTLFGEKLLTARGNEVSLRCCLSCDQASVELGRPSSSSSPTPLFLRSMYASADLGRHRAVACTEHETKIVRQRQDP